MSDHPPAHDPLQGGGHVIPDGFDTVLRAQLYAPTSPYAYVRRELPPLSRQDRLKVKLYDLRWRIVTAVEVLRGQHECWYD